MGIFNFDAIYTMFNTCVNTNYSPFGGNSKLHSSKEGRNPKEISKRRAKNRNKKTHRQYDKRAKREIV